MHTSTSIEPSLLPSCPSPPHPSTSRSIHLGATLIRASLFSILHPLSLFSSQPQFPIDLLIAVCLWESGRSLPLLSPAWICLPFPLLSSPARPLRPLHLPIDAAALKHELEKAGESNLPREIGFVFSCAHSFFLCLTFFLSLTGSCLLHFLLVFCFRLSSLMLAFSP